MACLEVGTEKNRIYKKRKKLGQSGMRMKVGSEQTCEEISVGRHGSLIHSQ